jgi:tetratricopeptide (TPR) repeat protein
VPSDFSSSHHPGLQIRRPIKSFVRNILHVSTLIAKILHRPRTAQPQWNQRLTAFSKGLTSAFLLVHSTFCPLRPILSRFYVQLLWIQRFWLCSPSNLLISKDRWGRGDIPQCPLPDTSEQSERFFKSAFLTAVVVLISSVAANGQVSAPTNSKFHHLATQADEARNAERLTEAQSLYRQALALKPSWSEGWWSLGTILYDSDNYPGAARAFRHLVALDPKNGTARLMLALCQYQLDQDDSALRNIESAKTLGIKKDDQLRHVLEFHEGMLLLRKGRYEDAFKIFRPLLDEGVRSDELIAALGMGALMINPREAPSEGSAERQILSRAGEAERYNLLRMYEDARNGYRDLTQQFPDFPNIHYAYGRVLFAFDDPEGAIAQFQQEIKNNPSHVRARVQIAIVRYRVDSAAAIPYAREVVALQPKYPFGHYLLGLLYLDSGDLQRSIPELETAARMLPREAQFQFALGNAYAKAGRKQDAARARAAFRGLGGENPSNGSDSYGEQRPLNLDAAIGLSPKNQDRKQR